MRGQILVKIHIMKFLKNLLVESRPNNTNRQT
jgi:hypothetical protein